jgi:hypothetical protein
MTFNNIEVAVALMPCSCGPATGDCPFPSKAVEVGGDNDKSRRLSTLKAELRKTLSSPN